MMGGKESCSATASGCGFWSRVHTTQFGAGMVTDFLSREQRACGLKLYLLWCYLQRCSCCPGYHCFAPPGQKIGGVVTSVRTAKLDTHSFLVRREES